MSQDPIGLRGGTHLYQYGPNPIGWNDPLGLTSCKPVLDKGKCKALLAKIYAKSRGRKDITGNRGLMERIEHLHEDKYKLYDFAPTMDKARSYGSLAGKGSWEGHVDAANQLKIGLNKNIQDFEAGGCNQHYEIPDSVHRIAGMTIPHKPAGR